MITEARIKSLILEALKTVKESEPAYRNLALNDQTPILGKTSALDSIAFTAFATDLEEKVEDETGNPYVLRVEEITRAHGKQTPIRVADLARAIAGQIQKPVRKR